MYNERWTLLKMNQKKFKKPDRNADAVFNTNFRIRASDFMEANANFQFGFLFQKKD